MSHQTVPQGIVIVLQVIELSRKALLLFLQDKSLVHICHHLVPCKGLRAAASGNLSLSAIFMCEAPCGVSLSAYLSLVTLAACAAHCSPHWHSSK